MLKTDFDKLKEGQRITLHPLPDNPLHSKPVRCTYVQGFFYCDGSDPIGGPDYYLGDIIKYNEGYTDE